MKIFGFTIERDNKKVNEVVVDGTAEEIEVDPNQKKFNGKKALAIGVAATAVVGGILLAVAKGHSDDSEAEPAEVPEPFEYDKFETDKFESCDDQEIKEMTEKTENNEVEEG